MIFAEHFSDIFRCMIIFIANIFPCSLNRLMKISILMNNLGILATSLKFLTISYQSKSKPFKMPFFGFWQLHCKANKMQVQYIIVFYYVDKTNFEILKTQRVTPSKFNFSSVCPFNSNLDPTSFRSSSHLHQVAASPGLLNFCSILFIKYIFFYFLAGSINI